MVSHPWCEDDGCSSSGGAYGFRHVRLQLKTETDEGEWGDSSLKPWKPSSRRGPRLSKCRIRFLVVLRLHLGMGYAVNVHFLLTKDCKARGISSVWFSLNSWLSIDPILLDLFWVFVSPHPLTLVMFSSSDAGWCSCPFPFSELLLLKKFMVFENRHFQVVCMNGVSSPKCLCKMPVLAAHVDIHVCDVIHESDCCGPMAWSVCVPVLHPCWIPHCGREGRSTSSAPFGEGSHSD